MIHVKQTLSDKIFNWFSSVKEWFQSAFGPDENAKDKSLYERYWWLPDVFSLIALVVAIVCHFSK